MNTRDSLELLETLDQRAAHVRRRAALVAWGSVALAALVMAALMWQSSRYLARAHAELARTEE